MKTPEEIKKGLEYCPLCNKSCPYHNEKDCYEKLHYDTLALINQLQEDKKQLERERDAAVEDIRKAAFCGCHVCKSYYRPDPAIRKYACRKFGSFEEHDFIADDGSIYCGAFEWRGPQEVN